MELRVRRLILLAVAALCAPANAQAVQRLAVLTPSAPWSPRCSEAGKRVDEKLEERCALLETLADEVRAGALAAVGTRDVDVMTRENTAQLLGENAALCTEGACEVETAKIIGADYVVSGNLVLFEATWLVTLKLHAVKTARLLHTSERLEGSSQLAIVKAVRASADAMVRAGLGIDPGAPRSGLGRADEPRSPWYVTADGALGFPQGPTLASGDHPSKTPFFGARAGYRTSPTLAWEIITDLYAPGADGHFGIRSAPDGSAVKASLNAIWVLAGAEWSLLGKRNLAFAAGAGGGVSWVRVEATRGGTGDSVSATPFVPAVSAELRLSRAFGTFELGLAGGASAFYLLEAPRKVTAPGGSLSLEMKSGLVLVPRLNAFIRLVL